MDIRDLKAASEHAQSGIYKIFDVYTHFVYVGSAVNISKRWQWHIKDLKANKHRNKYLQNAWNKYGENAFRFQIIECCNKEQLIELEQSWINVLNCVRPNGYNLAPKAGSSLGIKRSAETKEKQRQLKLGKKQKPEHVEAKRQANIGVKRRSEQEKQALKERSLGNKFALGYKQTEKAKSKISATHKGKPKSEEHKKKISETLKRKRLELNNGYA